jgi:hypothetical protein
MYYPYLWYMTFKELANELMEQGWRCYRISDISQLTRGSSLHSWAIRNALEVRVYEGKSLVFVKDTKPLEIDEPV